MNLTSTQLLEMLVNERIYLTAYKLTVRSQELDSQGPRHTQAHLQRHYMGAATMLAVPEEVEVESQVALAEAAEVEEQPSP